MTKGFTLPKKKATTESPTRYAVHSVNTGGLVCGPYDKQADAKSECERLSREAARGRTDPSEAHPQGQDLSRPGDPQLMHEGQRQGYEVRSGEGVIL